MACILWPRSPVPQTRGITWQWQIATVRQLSMLRAQLRSRLRSAGCDDATGEGDPVSDRVVLAVDELTSNGLWHGVGPVGVRIVGTVDGWLIDISDAAAERGPEPAVGRRP